MGFLVLIVIATIFLIIGLSPKISNTSNCHNVANKAPVPQKVFQHDNPHEIYEITQALSFIAAVAGDSHVYVVLQDENPAKGWARSMSIRASLDNCITSRQDYIPAGVRKYLESVPFIIQRSAFNYDLEYTFAPPPAIPSGFKYGIIDEMKTGASRSSFVMHGLHTINISDRGGLIILDVDG